MIIHSVHSKEHGWFHEGEIKDKGTVKVTEIVDLTEYKNTPYILIRYENGMASIVFDPTTLIGNELTLYDEEENND